MDQLFYKMSFELLVNLDYTVLARKSQKCHSNLFSMSYWETHDAHLFLFWWCYLRLPAWGGLSKFFHHCQYFSLCNQEAFWGGSGGYKLEDELPCSHRSSLFFNPLILTSITVIFAKWWFFFCFLCLVIGILLRGLYVFLKRGTQNFLKSSGSVTFFREDNA